MKLFRHVSVVVVLALLTTPLMSYAETLSMGYNKYDLFANYIGTDQNAKLPASWSIVGGGPSGSEAVRYGPILNNAFDGVHFLRLTTAAGSSTPLFVHSSNFPITSSTDYTLSAYIRKSNSTGNFKIVMFNAAGDQLGENNVAILGSGVDLQGQNWDDGWNLVKRQFSFTSPVNAASAYIQFELNPIAGTQIMDIDSASLTTASSSANGVPNPSFELGDATQSQGLAREALDAAQSQNISYMRINGGLYCGYDFNLWKNYPTQYWSAYDTMMNDLSQRNIKVVPSILWNIFAFPSMAGEPISKLFDVNSQSNHLLKQYTSDLVNRYKNNSTILFWELTNEINLFADLDNDARATQDYCFHVLPTPGSNNFSTDQMIAFMKDYAQYVKSLDPVHSISSGYSFRPSAYHLRLHPEWTGADWTIDSFSEMQKNLFDTHPDPLDIISVHLYPNGGTNWGAGDIQRANSAFGKKVFIGEYGDYNADDTWKQNPQFAQNVVNDIVKYRIPYSAPWTFEWLTTAFPKTYQPNSFAPDFASQVMTMVNTANAQLALPAQPDTIAPVVSITSPAQNTTTSTTTTITAVSSDDVRITKVEFYLDTTLIGTDTTYPYATTTNPQNYARGLHSITAKSYDSSNNIGTSSISVTFVDTTIPSVSITSPLNNSTVGRNTNVTINAQASDISGISKVEFYVNNALKCTDSVAPYSCEWAVPASKNVQYTLQAKAYDTAGNTNTSSVTVTSK